MTKSRRYLILTIAIMVFIFVQSALPSDLSGAESGWIAGFLVRVFGLPEEGLHLVIRKLAHFTEYLVLGVSLCLTVKYGAWRGNAEGSIGGAGGSGGGDCSGMDGGDRSGGSEMSGARAGGRFRLRDVIGVPGTLTFAGRVLAWGTGALYAVTDEFHQLFVAGRSCDFRDMCIDAAGVLCGCALYSIFH